MRAIDSRGWLAKGSRRWRTIALSVLATATSARADDPPAANPAGATKADRTGKPEREVGLFPLIGGDTDNGFGAGVIGNVVLFDPGNPVYRWKVDFQGFYATKGFPPTPSYIDAATTLTIPQLLDDHLRFEVRPSFTIDKALPFYGFGNMPTVPGKTEPGRDYYERIHPSLAVRTRWRLSRHWYVVEGANVTYNKITADPTSTLARDLTAVDPYLMKGHGIVRVETGLAYDTRDNEPNPNSGQWHSLTLRASPSIGDALPYAYAQYNLTSRWFWTLWYDTLVLAVRGVVDLQTGNVPFYEESRFDDTSAIGGGQGVRGVPAYSYYGRVKAFGNIELRAKVWRFTKLDRKFTVGFATFFDAGRLWTDVTEKHHELDGTGLGLHYGIGGGLRVKQGRAFVVRADVAWSPDARPVSAYVTAEQAF